MARSLAALAVNLIAASPLWSPRARARLMQRFGVKVGAGTSVYPQVLFVGRADQFSTGARCFLNARLTVGSGASVSLADDVFLGPGVSLLPTSHEVGPSERRAGKTVSRPIVLGRGSWIGAGVVVLGGVTVGPGTIIAAGAVVTGDCEPDSLYAGVPARRLRALDGSAIP